MLLAKVTQELELEVAETEIRLLCTEMLGLPKSKLLHH